MSCQSPIKVVHLASGDRWAGAEVQLYTLLTQLHLSPNIEISAILLNEGELAARLRAHGIAVHVLDESKLASATIFRQLIQLLQALKPHVVHTHRQKENILGAIANLCSVRAICIRSAHGAAEFPPKSLSQRAVRFLDRWIGNHLQQRVIAVSDDLATKLSQLFKRDRIVVIENGVDIEAVRAAVKSVEFREQEPHAIHIGIVGRLDPVKRIDIFLDMAAALLREQPTANWRFHVLGEGALEQGLKAQADRLGIQNKVCFHGHRSDIASCLAGLDAVVMCSDHEGLPMTVLEALTVGTPMVAHAVGGLATVLAGDAGGVLVKSHTAAGYAAAITHLLAQDRQCIREKGYRRIQERYSAQHNAKLIEQLYTELLKLPTVL